MAGPLAHIRVLDLARVLAGPWAAQNLADLGAEVIKVERPKKGDDSRAYGPPWLKDANGSDTTESAYFACANRGKKSVTLDLANPEGQAIVRELAARGMRLRGPVPADTAFIPAQLKGVDAVLAMYHDQGLPVLKHHDFAHAVNVTLGLPFVRTSVDHGTALELAGTGKADPSSLHAALELAIELTRKK